MSETFFPFSFTFVGVTKDCRIREEVREEKEVHAGVTCDGCGVFPLRGARWKRGGAPPSRPRAGGGRPRELPWRERALFNMPAHDRARRPHVHRRDEEDARRQDDRDEGDCGEGQTIKCV